MTAFSSPVPEVPASPETPGRGFRKVLRRIDLTLFTVCAILEIDTLAPSASLGPSSISMLVITLVVFFIPYALITAELGSTYPEQGGLFAWVRKAFGSRWAARTSWLYWINVALWMPLIYIIFATIFSQLFFPSMGYWGKILIGIGLTWVTVWIGIVSLDTGKAFPNLGAVMKASIILIISLGAIVLASQRGIANDLSLPKILPTWNSGLAFLPVIVFNLMGLELVSGAGEEIKNPSRDIPRAIFTSGILIAFFYLLGTVAMLVAVPVDALGEVRGIVDTLKAIFGTVPAGNIIVAILGIGALFTLLANWITWTMGATRTVAEAATKGDLPSVFGRLHPVYKTPVGAFVITGLVSTTVIILYGFFTGNLEQLFWTLFSFSSIIFLMPYLGLFPAFLKLRASDPNASRPFRVPGGPVLAWLMAIICLIFIIQGIVFFVWVPGHPVDWSFAGPVLTGVAVTLVIGEALLWLVRSRD